MHVIYSISTFMFYLSYPFPNSHSCNIQLTSCHASAVQYTLLPVPIICHKQTITIQQKPLPITALNAGICNTFTDLVLMQHQVMLTQKSHAKSRSQHRIKERFCDVGILITRQYTLYRSDMLHKLADNNIKSLSSLQ